MGPHIIFFMHQVLSHFVFCLASKHNNPVKEGCSFSDAGTEDLDPVSPREPADPKTPSLESQLSEPKLWLLIIGCLDMLRVLDLTMRRTGSGNEWKMPYCEADV